MKTIEAKDPAEIVTATFAYAGEIGSAAITSQLITVEVVAGADATPANLLSGASQVQGADVLQNLKDGVVGVRYKVKCLATLSDGRKLLRTLLIDVRAL